MVPKSKTFREGLEAFHFWRVSESLSYEMSWSENREKGDHQGEVLA